MTTTKPVNLNLDNYTVEGRLVLRTCDENMRSYGENFQWPQPGEIAEATDWKPTKECGNGLHGLLEGNGDGSLCDWNDSARWLVLDTLDSEIIQLFGKVKFRKCRVLFVGKLEDAIKVLRHLGVAGTIVGDHVEVGDFCMASAGRCGTVTTGRYGSATAGDDGTASTGYDGIAIAGHVGKAIAGHDGTATAGHYGIAKAGSYGRATVRDHGTASAGNHGKAIAGDHGIASAGNHGKATAGKYGTAVVGNGGTALVGVNGYAAAGKDGVIIIAYNDLMRGYRYTIGYVGENGIQPNVLYRADNTGKLIPADENEKSYQHKTFAENENLQLANESHELS